VLAIIGFSFIVSGAFFLGFLEIELSFFSKMFKKGYEVS
jgi:hypothetical protein